MPLQIQVRTHTIQIASCIRNKLRNNMNFPQHHPVPTTSGGRIIRIDYQNFLVRLREEQTPIVRYKFRRKHIVCRRVREM